MDTHQIPMPVEDDQPGNETSQTWATFLGGRVASDTCTSGVAEPLENEDGPVSFVVPHHFSIVKRLTEGQGAPHNTMTMGKPAPHV